MKPERILLPIDVARFPLEGFELVNGIAKRRAVTVYLLHVVTLNIMAGENRIYEELAREAHRHLQELAERFIHPIASVVSHVRVGNLGEEILAEAKEERVDLIILPNYGPSFWARLLALWKPGSNPVVSLLAAKIIREAASGVFVVPAKSRFNRERLRNSRPESRSGSPEPTARGDFAKPEPARLRKAPSV
jgi:nucleotide-binding universal stress UspA family protein